MLDAAMTYAEKGYRVFPVREWDPFCDGKDCLCKAPLVAHGFQEATRDPVKIRRWWSIWPQANIGIATGLGSADVLDVDVHSGDGYESLRILITAGLGQGWCRAVSTPSGGRHLYFAGTDQRNGSIRRCNLDFRSTGGYVLAPPSRVHRGTYEVLGERPGTGLPLNWQAVRDMLVPRRPVAPMIPGNPTQLVNYVLHLEPGMRNNGLYWAMKRSVDEKMSDLTQLVNAGIACGLAERDILATAQSALRGMA